MDHRIVPARHARTMALIGLSAAMALGLALGGRAFADDEDNSGIVPPDAKIHGKTYGSGAPDGGSGLIHCPSAITRSLIPRKSAPGKPETSGSSALPSPHLQIARAKP